MTWPNTASPEKPIRVLLVEDHFLARMALHGVLDSQPGIHIVAETGKGEDAATLFQQHLPDVVIMDLRLNGMSGFDAIDALRNRYQSARILVISNFHGSEDIYRAVQSGVRGYLTKDADGRQVVDAVRAVAAGGRYLPREIDELLAGRFPGAHITPRELEVLELLAEGLSTTGIAKRMTLAEKTVRIHIGNLLEKLGARDRTQALVVALQRGIIHLN